MSSRNTPLVTGEIYHIFNRSVAQQPIFTNLYDKNHFLNLIEYYRFENTNLRYSFFTRLAKEEKQTRLDWLYQHSKINVDIFSLSLMPNHFHLLVQQISDRGIFNYMSRLQDSYAKYINKKTNRSGSLFLSPFKAVRIENENQLLHVARYIHLNPLTSYVIKEEKNLLNYPWNSYLDYLNNKPRPFIDISKIKSFFKNNEQFRSFTMDQLDYQRQLDQIKHLTFE